MLDYLTEAQLVALIGGLGGVMLGLAARIGRFCTLGAIEDLYYGDSSLRLRMWGIAIGVAVVGTFALSAAGWLDLERTLYLSRSWNPVASVAGGVTFGYGMALAGNCGYGALARLGGGDLRSFVIVLVMGLAAYITLGGPLSGLRLWLFGDASQQNVGMPGFADGLAALTGVSVNLIGMLCGAAILFLTLLHAPMRRARGHLFWGTVVGLAIVSGWAGTQWVAVTGFDATPVLSHTFSAPLGETILYTMTSSGNSLSFGIGSVVGVLIGAFAGSLIMGHFRWEACDDARELRRQMLGAGLMGMGAVVTVGCSVGQGLSAFSVLAYSAPLTMVSIGAGAAIGLHQLIVGFAPGV